MGFGNPYGDDYSVEMVAQFVDILSAMGVKIISLADTIGVSNQENITYLYSTLIEQFPTVEFGALLHSNPKTARLKFTYAYDAGCTRFDGAIRGFGGCPMAKDDLIGNIATEEIISFFENRGVELSLNRLEFDNSIVASGAVFDHFH